MILDVLIVETQFICLSKSLNVELNSSCCRCRCRYANDARSYGNQKYSKGRYDSNEFFLCYSWGAGERTITGDLDVIIFRLN